MNYKIVLNNLKLLCLVILLLILILTLRLSIEKIHINIRAMNYFKHVAIVFCFSSIKSIYMETIHARLNIGLHPLFVYI